LIALQPVPWFGHSIKYGCCFFLRGSSPPQVFLEQTKEAQEAYTAAMMSSQDLAEGSKTTLALLDSKNLSEAVIADMKVSLDSVAATATAIGDFSRFVDTKVMVNTVNRCVHRIMPSRITYPTRM
jgi:hypothetical protein